MKYGLVGLLAVGISCCILAQNTENAEADVSQAPEAAVEIVSGGRRLPNAVAMDASADQVLSVCRAMLPKRPVGLTGALILRNRKGIVAAEYDYNLLMRRTPEISLLSIKLLERGSTNMVAEVTISRQEGKQANIRLFGSDGKMVTVSSPLERVLGTDVTWLDLTFDYLWWHDAVYEAEREGESIHGQVCRVILVRPPNKIEGLSAVRLWVDKKTGCLMQAEQVNDKGEAIRRLWGTRVKKFDGKWMVSVLEVETLGARHRTKITVDEVKEM